MIAERAFARPSVGQPDLQGVWVNNSATPLERPKALEGRPFLVMTTILAGARLQEKNATEAARPK